MNMLIVNKRMIIKVFYIAIGVFCVLTTVRCQDETEQKTDLIYYRKCCEENQVYEVRENYFFHPYDKIGSANPMNLYVIPPPHLLIQTRD